MKWISVKDRLPKKQYYTDCHFNNLNIRYIVYNGKYVIIGHWKENKFYNTSNAHPLKNITHWMELPEPPK